MNAAERRVMEQALEALEAGPDVDPIFAGETEAALRAALAQQPEPAQEPVATPWKSMCELALEQRTKAYAQRDALRAELKEATKAINDPAVNNLRTLAESIRMLSNQRDALLEALKRMASIIDKMGDMPDGFIHPSPWQELKCEEALTQARAAIKAVEERE